MNFIGEEVLGEEEANARFEKYSQALKSNYIQYISIKITTIFSQINILDFEYSKKEIVKRLDALYALALEEEKSKACLNLLIWIWRNLGIWSSRWSLLWNPSLNLI